MQPTKQAIDADFVWVDKKADWHYLFAGQAKVNKADIFNGLKVII
jgi:hypothetical protein